MFLVFRTDLKWKQWKIITIILLLADVFEKFGNNSLKNKRLCPSHYLNAPVLSWDAMLNMGKVELELIPYPNMQIFFEKGTRIGVSYIFNRYSKANNKYLKPYDSKQESKHIIYLDTNNLYGYATFKFLPTSSFKLIDPKEFDLIQKDVFSELIMNVQKNYQNYTMIIH